MPVFMSSCSWVHSLPQSHTKGIVVGVVVVGAGIFLTWLHRSVKPPAPKICGSPNGPPVTAPRLKLKDGRHIAYKETGVPRDIAHYKVIYVHGFKSGRNWVPKFPEIFLRENSVYVLSFDRAGYGQSDPNPKRNIESEAHDVEEIADLLEIGDTFYLLVESIGGYTGYGCMKYIAHRLAGVGMIAPVTNFWWKCFSKEELKQGWGTQFLVDRLFLRVVHYLPWLTYFWITQPFIPAPNPINMRLNVLNPSDREVLLTIGESMQPMEEIQQGIAESLCRDATTMFGNWEFDPSELENPFSDRTGAVHVWQGDEDYLVPVALQRAIHKKLPWIHYHEVKARGHFLSVDGDFSENVLKTLLFGVKFEVQGSVSDGPITG